jgi:hypothetical protein
MKTLKMFLTLNLFFHLSSKTLFSQILGSSSHGGLSLFFFFFLLLFGPQIASRPGLVKIWLTESFNFNSGDHDMTVPNIGTQEWIRSLNLTVDESWRVWSVNGQTAGWVSSC